MLGDYSKLITLLPNGQIRLNIIIDLSMQDALSLYNIFQQPKQYTSNGTTIKEGDTEFDINKWIQLAINEFKNK